MKPTDDETAASPLDGNPEIASYTTAETVRGRTIEASQPLEDREDEPYATGKPYRRVSRARIAHNGD